MIKIGLGVARVLVVAALLFPAAALASARAPGGAAAVITQVATFPKDGQTRVLPDATLYFVFDQPTLKTGAFSVADFDPSSGGGLINLDVPRWSALGDTAFLKPLASLPLGHLFGMRVNSINATDGTATFDLPIVYFTVLARAKVERVQPGNVSLALTPDVTLPVPIPVRETAGTDVSFTSVRVQFLPSSEVANTEPTPLDASVMPLYETTGPISEFLPRNGAARLEAPVLLPGSVARNIPQGRLGARLTFYGTDETSNSVVVDAFFRVDPATVSVHQAGIVPAMASDLIVRSAALEWPLHGATFAAGDTIVPRAVVAGNGTGAFRASFYMDGDLISIEEGFMEGGRPVEVEMRGPLPTRRLGEHRLQFQVESPQAVPANPISFLCAPPPNGLAPRRRTAPPPPPSAATLHTPRLTGAATWIAEGRSHFRAEDASAVGWGAWRGGYEISEGRRLEAELSMRLRFDDVGNGRGAPQRMKLRYSSPRASLEWSDAAPAGAMDTPLLMSPVPRRAAQASLSRTPLGNLDAYVAMESHPISAGGAIRETQSDLYAARLTRSLWRERVHATLYGGYTHEDPTPGGADTRTQRRLTYGAMGRWDLPGAWALLADAATVHHRGVEGAEAARSRTAWRGELSGRAAGFAALAQAFSYQPDLATALNPYALSNRRGGFAQLSRDLLKWRVFGSFRSEQPVERTGLEPFVRVDRSTIGARLELNQQSWVIPSFVRVTHRGANAEFTENRIATEFSAAEPMGGRTTARFDVVVSEDGRGFNTRKRLTSGSVVSTRRHPGRVVSTLTLGLEQSRLRDLDLTDTTVQGSFEARWEAVAGRLLVTPFIAGSARTYEQQGTKDNRYSARLQISLLRVPGLAENALSLEGRIDRLERLTPSGPSRTDGSVQLTVGQRFDLGGRR